MEKVTLQGKDKVNNALDFHFHYSRLKAGFHMIANDRGSQIADNRRRSQKRLFPYNRNDRRADRRHTSNIHARVG